MTAGIAGIAGASPEARNFNPLETDASNDNSMSHRNRNDNGKSFLTQKLSSFEAAAKVTSSLNIHRNPNANQSAVAQLNKKIESIDKDRKPAQVSSRLN